MEKTRDMRGWETSAASPRIARTLAVHVWRILRVWSRQPELYVVTFIAPLAYLFIVVKLFGGFIRQLTGSLDMNDITILVAIAWAFVAVFISSSTVLAERKSGLYDRFRTLATPFPIVVFAWLIAEFLRCLAMMYLVTAVAAVTTSFDLLQTDPLTLALVTAVVAMSAASVGVLVSFSISTQQGSIALIPIIVVLMFVNTALLPEDRFAPALRTIARNTPISAAVQMLRSAHNQTLNGAEIATFILWFGGLTLLGIIGITRTSRHSD